MGLARPDGQVGPAAASSLPLILLICDDSATTAASIEDIWLIGIAVVIVVIVLCDWRRRKNAWRAE